MKGVAFAHADERKGQALEGTVFFDGLDGVFRAGREKTATMAKKRADG